MCINDKRQGNVSVLCPFRTVVFGKLQWAPENFRYLTHTAGAEDYKKAEDYMKAIMVYNQFNQGNNGIHIFFLLNSLFEMTVSLYICNVQNLFIFFLETFFTVLLHL